MYPDFLRDRRLNLRRTVQLDVANAGWFQSQGCRRSRSTLNPWQRLSNIPITAGIWISPAFPTARYRRARRAKRRPVAGPILKLTLGLFLLRASIWRKSRAHDVFIIFCHLFMQHWGPPHCCNIGVRMGFGTESLLQDGPGRCLVLCPGRRWSAPF